MIIIQLNGGLGNQMFQYALGRNLSLKHRTKLLFDTTSFLDQAHTDTKRDYQLSVYNLPVDIAPEKIISYYGRPNKYALYLNKLLNININPYPPNYFKEKSFEFNPEVLEVSGNAYLSGYWQSENYFLSIRQRLLSDFSRRNKARSAENTNLSNEIKNSTSVSLHIRRTDFVTNSRAQKYHGNLEISYYQRAMSLIERKIKKPTYYAFSDDPDWTSKNLKSKNQIIYISNNLGADSHEDLRLMSECKHNIIANSSFSWWGAWLNSNTDKIVISPSNWFSRQTINTTDLIPAGWLKI